VDFCFLHPPGSPLNRVSFLRGDHAFLSSALKHPTTNFLIFNQLNPLSKSPTELAYASYQDVKPLIADDPYSKSEDDVVKQYNSSTYIPQLVFLGLDERRNDGIVYKELYKGAPFFALDVTPKGSLTAAAEELISTLQSRGLSFIEARMHLSLPAQEGVFFSRTHIRTPLTKFSSRNLRRSPPCPRLERAQPLLCPMWPAHPLR